LQPVTASSASAATAHGTSGEATRFPNWRTIALRLATSATLAPPCSAIDCEHGAPIRIYRGRMTKPSFRLPFLAGSVVFAAGLLAGLALAGTGAAPAADPAAKITFDNPRVTVKEITLAPGGKRAGRTRETDELVLFHAESHYQAVDDAGKIEARDRAPGAVVWHKRGERAPTLVNPGKTAVRYYSIAIK
jgi:hypothetical protein